MVYSQLLGFEAAGALRIKHGGNLAAARSADEPGANLPLYVAHKLRQGRVGIIALVDEATGYQDVRAQNALAKILEAFVAKELQPYHRVVLQFQIKESN